MQAWHTDKIIGFGLIIALLLKIAGDIVITLYTGTSPPADLPMNIVTGLAGYMGRVLVEESKKEGKNDDNNDKHNRNEFTAEKRQVSRPAQNN